MYRTANAAILTADLTPALFRAAHALLAQADPTTGRTLASRADVQAAVGAGAWGTAKNRLSVLKRQGLITYTAGDMVAVQFVAWQDCHVQPLQSSPVAVTIVTSSSDNSVTSSGDNSALSPLDVTIVTPSGDNRHVFPPTPPRVSERDPDPTQDPDTSLTPAPAQTATAPAPTLTAQQLRTANMLTALGIVTATDLAARCDFGHCRDHALVWLDERTNTPDLNAGILAWRIANRARPVPPTVTTTQVHQFRRDWPTEIEAERDAFWEDLSRPLAMDTDPGRAEPEDDPAPRPTNKNSQISNLTSDPIWTQALAQLSQQMTTATYDTWLRDTTLLSLGDGPAIIQAPNEHTRSWLDDKLTATVRRTLGGIMQRSVAVEFVTA